MRVARFRATRSLLADDFQASFTRSGDDLNDLNDLMNSNGDDGKCSGDQPRAMSIDLGSIMELEPEERGSPGKLANV